jgi:broad specificity phosphatase PhoE
LSLARHGESAGNLASDAAEAGGHARLDLATRDMDVPLSPLGEEQARSLGRWLGEGPAGRRPTVVLSSPYLRATTTARMAIDAAGWDNRLCELIVDERLREREFGILDRLTWAGVNQLHPEQAAARAFLGKFYHRPPGGESWCDVVLRLRTVLDTITREYGGEHVLVVSHQVVILLFRYLLEKMTEQDILAVDRQHRVANCSITSYRFDPAAGPNGGMVLEQFNQVAPLEEHGTQVTEEPDVATAPR